MTRTMHIGFMFILAAAIALGGCGGDDKDKSSSKTTNDKTATGGGSGSGPEAALKNMAEAYKNADIDTVVETFWIQPEDKPFVKALFTYANTMKAFQDKLKASYSAEDLEAAGFMVQDSNILTPEEVEDIDIEVNGDQATATIQGKQPTRLVKKDGKWLIVMEGGLPPESMRQQMLDTINMTGKIYEDLMPKIGAEGVTAQDIQDEYREKFGEAMQKLSK